MASLNGQAPRRGGALFNVYELREHLNWGYGPLRVAFIYALFGALWIVFSDNVVDRWVDLDAYRYAQTLKGLAFILISAGLIYLLVDYSLRRERESEGRFRQLFENAPMGIAVLDPEGHPKLTNRSVRLAHSCLNRNKADFLLHRGRFHRRLATTASAFLSTG